MIPQKQSPNYVRALAEKIMLACGGWAAPESELTAHIESLLSAALEEAQICYECADHCSPRRLAEAKAAAYEECAKIVKDFNLPDGNEFYWYKQKYAAAEKIRSLCQR